MLELFLVGTVGFWILLAVEFIVLLVLTENEKPGWGLVSLIALALLLHYLGNFSLAGLVYTYPGQTAAIVFGYFVVGTIWAVAKWYFFVRARRTEVLARKEDYEKHPEREYLDGKGMPSNMATGNNVSWEKSRARMELLNSKGTLAPLARDNKSRILHWMAYWPWSALWTLIHDAVTKIYKTIYENIHKLLQSISDNAFKDVK